MSLWTFFRRDRVLDDIQNTEIRSCGRGMALHKSSLPEEDPGLQVMLSTIAPPQYSKVAAHLFNDVEDRLIVNELDVLEVDAFFDIGLQESSRSISYTKYTIPRTRLEAFANLDMNISKKTASSCGLPRE